MLEQDDGQWFLLDPGVSRHGSFVNGERVLGRRALADGDVLRFGETVVLLRAQAPRHERAALPLDPSAVTSLGGIAAVSLDASERRVLELLAEGGEPSVDARSPGEDAQAAFARLARKFSAEDRPPVEQRQANVARAKGIGLLGQRDRGDP